jgi:hypothetical protein
MYIVIFTDGIKHIDLCGGIFYKINRAAASKRLRSNVRKPRYTYVKRKDKQQSASLMRAQHLRTGRQAKEKPFLR